MSRKLYELTQDFKNLEELLDNPEIDNVEIEKALNEVAGKFVDKAENICKIRAIILSDIEGIKAEEKRLKDLKKQKENAIKNLENYLEANMRALDQKKVEGGLFTLSIKKNPPSVLINDLEVVPSEFKVIKIEANKTAIKNILKAGGSIEGCSLEQKESLKIK